MKIISNVYCGKCKIAKRVLKEKGYEIEELDSSSAEAEKILKEHDIRELPVIIYEDKIIFGNDALNFANKIGKA